MRLRQFLDQTTWRNNAEFPATLQANFEAKWNVPKDLSEFMDAGLAVDALSNIEAGKIYKFTENEAGSVTNVMVDALVKIDM